MILVIISCFWVFFISKSITRRHFPLFRNGMKLFFPYISLWLLLPLRKSRLFISFFKVVPHKKNPTSKVENLASGDENSLLDLPELALESILDRLSPFGLCNTSMVCTSLRDRCRSDHLWEKHMKKKWGRLIGKTAYREWQWHNATRKAPSVLKKSNRHGFFGVVSSVWPFSWVRPKVEITRNMRNSTHVDSIMAFYLALERGEFQFPAQVYNRENQHVGFMLSCYDALVSYDSHRDDFVARYSPSGRQTSEENVDWDRLRPPPLETPAYDLHASDCLDDLKPGDHIEIQWRRCKEFPYGWWYGVIGHLESCGGNENHCQCDNNDIVVLEFNQYALGSRWRQTIVDRRSHKEEGNEVDGFYGGIRKIYCQEEISVWRRLWPKRNLE